MPQNKNDSRTSRQAEAGNIFVIVMLGVFLFAALMFTFSRGAQQGTGNIDDKQATLAATDIIAHAQKIKRGVDRIYRRGYSESDISFENSFVSGYINANCSSDDCKVFAPDGGSVNWQTPQINISDGSDWLFAGNVQVADIGTTASNATSSELIAFLPGLDQNVCQKINDSLELGFSSIPVNAGSIDRVEYDGSFSFDDSITGITGAGLTCPPALLCDIDSACFQEETGTAQYIFYSVLLER